MRTKFGAALSSLRSGIEILEGAYKIRAEKLFLLIKIFQKIIASFFLISWLVEDFVGDCNRNKNLEPFF